MHQEVPKNCEKLLRKFLEVWYFKKKPAKSYFFEKSAFSTMSHSLCALSKKIYFLFEKTAFCILNHVMRIFRKINQGVKFRKDSNKYILEHLHSTVVWKNTYPDRTISKNLNESPWNLLQDVWARIWIKFHLKVQEPQKSRFLPSATLDRNRPPKFW